MFKRASLVAILVLSVVGLLGTTVHADTISISYTYGPSEPDWTWNVAVPKYNGPETLTSVDISMSGSVGGNMAFENRASSPATITMTLSGILTLNGPASFGSPLVVSPTVTKSELVTAYDKSMDFSGDSGRTYNNVSQTKTSPTVSLTGNLADFLGAGDVLFSVNGTSESIATGSGRLTSQFDALAGATLNVVYHTVPVPEPSVLMGLGGLGLVGLVLAWRRRRA